MLSAPPKLQPLILIGVLLGVMWAFWKAAQWDRIESDDEVRARRDARYNGLSLEEALWKAWREKRRKVSRWAHQYREGK